MINAEMLNNAGIDYAAGLERFLNDADLYAAVLTAFVSEDVLERAQKAYRADDRQLLLRTVHEAKGSSGNAGLDFVYAEASALVALLRSTGYTDEELKETYDHFTAAYMKARSAIKAALEA